MSAPPIDWRARAQLLERELDDLRRVVEDLMRSKGKLTDAQADLLFKGLGATFVQVQSFQYTGGFGQLLDWRAELVGAGPWPDPSLLGSRFMLVHERAVGDLREPAPPRVLPRCELSRVTYFDSPEWLLRMDPGRDPLDTFGVARARGRLRELDEWIAGVSIAGSPEVLEGYERERRELRAWLARGGR